MAQREVHSEQVLLSAMQEDLLKECAGFVNKLGTRPSILPCCGLILNERQLEKVRSHRPTCCISCTDTRALYSSVGRV